MQLYDYQKRITTATGRATLQSKRILLYSPTGSGKTIMSKYMIEKLIEKDNEVLFTVPRRKLAVQTFDKFGFGNILMGADTKDNKSLLTIGSIQTIYERKYKSNPKYVFIDECHYGAGTEMLKYIFETFKESIIIGLSATPIDENGYLLDGYDVLINEITVKQLIALGFLTDVEVYTSVIQPNFQDVSIINGDYNQVQVSEKVRESKILTNTLEEWERIGKGLKTLVFASTIEHSEDLKREFLSKGYNADVVHSKMRESEIEANYKRFTNNEIDILINVDMATFGFDEPSIECLLFARGVKSLRLYKQMIGRGIRKFEGKTKCIVIDCANVIEDNEFPTDEIDFIKKPIVSKLVDSRLGIERDLNGKITEESVKEPQRIEYLQRISNLLDLYANKVYTKESDLQDDIRKFIKKTNMFSWRQNSGTMAIDGRFVQFTDKKGLPDITLLFRKVYVGIEIKLPRGVLTKHQKNTLPEMINKGNLIFIAQSVIDIFDIIEHLYENIKDLQGNVIIKGTIDNLPEKQIEYRKKYKLPYLESI